MGFQLPDPNAFRPLQAYMQGKDDRQRADYNAFRMEQERNAFTREQTESAQKTARDFFQNVPVMLARVPPEQRAEKYQLLLQQGQRMGLDISLVPPSMTPEFSGLIDAMAPQADNRIGVANPSDFTPESLAAYSKTGDPGALVRQYPPQREVRPAPGQIVMTNQGPMIFDPNTRQLAPAQVPGAAPDTPILPPAQDPALQREKAGATAQGKLEGTQAAEAPQQLYDIADATQVLSDLQTAPGFAKMFGSIRGRIPSIQQDTASADALRLRALDLLALISRGQLKGTGAITDFEQKMVRQARTTLENTTQDPQQALAEVRRLLSWLEQKRSVAEQRASGNRPSFKDAQAKRGAVMDSRNATSIDDLVNKYAD